MLDLLSKQPLLIPQSTQQVGQKNPTALAVGVCQDKKFAVSAYAYVSCSAKGLQYQTEYDFLVELPSENFNIPHKREISSPNPRYGTFYDAIYLEGAVDGWNYVLSDLTVAAEANADGFCPANKKKHQTTSIAPTAINAFKLIYICDHCNDAGCSICNDHRVNK